MTNAFTASRLWGGQYSDPLIAAEFGADAFLERMLRFEAAWTRALVDNDIAQPDAGRQALAAIGAFDGERLSTGSERDGLPVPALVAAINAKLGDAAKSAFHNGATSQDVVDTAMVLTLLAVLDQLMERLDCLVSALDGLLAQYGNASLMARTRMQAALPATVALRVDAWRRPLVDHLARGETVKTELGTVQIGGPIGSRLEPQTHVERCAAHLAQSLGLSLQPVWHNDRSRMVAFGNWLALVAGSLGKIGQDVALMTQQGIDDIALKAGGASSAMAHKSNPVQAEAMVALARYVAGLQSVLSQAMIHEQERSGAAWALEWLTLPAMAEATGAALNHAAYLLSAVERIGAEPDAQ